MTLLSLVDPKWKELKGGYKAFYDASLPLRRLVSGEDVWNELWEELHHQGDVGDASYAAVPQLVRIGRGLPKRDWHFYGLLCTIEVERHRRNNPPIPAWLTESYAGAWKELFEIAQQDLSRVDENTVPSILSTLALAKNQLKLGALLIHLDASELDEIAEDKMAWTELYG